LPPKGLRPLTKNGRPAAMYQVYHYLRDALPGLFAGAHFSASRY
jgi:hypothetical protein